MGKTVTVKATAMVGLATLLTGIGVGGFVVYVRASQGLRSIALAQDLETAGLCANGLTLERRQDTERLVMLLQQRLDSAVDHATQLAEEGARLYPASPDLRDSARRAAEHYAAVNDLAKKQVADSLLAHLNEAP